jgi:hypothetical protein
MSTLLKAYIKSVLKEVNNIKDTKEKDIEESEEELTEFSSAGGVAGYSLPLGMNPDDAGRKKNKTK